MDKLSVGRFIAEQRKAKGLTQKQLAEAMNVTDKAVSKWETGRSYPDVETLERLSGFLGVTVNDVLSGKVISQISFAEEADKNIVQAMRETKKAKNILKGIIKGIVACLFLVGFVFGPVRFVMTFPHFFSESAELDGWELTYNNLFNAAYLDYYIADPNSEDFVITVPDEYNGMPVTKFGHGSAVPTMPFHIDASDLFMNEYAVSGYKYGVTKEEMLANTNGKFFRIENVVFKMHIGKNIKEIKDVDMDCYYSHINTDGSITFYHPVVEIYCSEENKHFYSEDGKLYKKSDGSLVRDFEYDYY